MRVQRLGHGRRLLILLTLAACLRWAGSAAHEIPADARLNVYVVPAGRVLSVLIRLPLGSMADIDYPTGPGNTVLVSRADPALRNAANVWLLPAIDVFEDGRALPPPRIAAARISLPSDRSFETWAEARASMERPPLPDSLGLYWSQQMIDVLLEYPIEQDRSSFELELRVDRFGAAVTTALRYEPPGGTARAFVLHGNAGRVALDPGRLQAGIRFTQEGVMHILSGTDHLLFLLCLVLPFRKLRPLLVIVTAFTVAHSISLGAAALGWGPDMLWFPPLVETAIAASIVYTALENIMGANVRRRWLLAFGFGLVHGFGFSFGLREGLQFAGRHLVTSLLAFNLGVEIGQVLVLLALIPALDFALSRVPSERIGVVVISALVAHEAWHWMEERWGELTKFPLPKLDVLLLTSAMRGLMAALILAGLVWIASGTLNRWLERQPGRR
ncbi:MAG TPA: HupE/UreJ family protein [Acetobacteraceae bacterium]|nr:HupE/UreJ family protein [Acetobacteraceae bacterium]